MKKLMCSAGALALTALPALAEETSGGTSSTVAENVLDGASSALQAIITSAGPVITTVVVAGLGLWGAIAIVGVVKRAFNSGKGR